jgi:hypothetical protein
VRFGVASARRAAALAAVAVVSVAASALATAPSAQAATCWQRVITDWRDGRITGTYSAACLHAALRNLPEDLRVYGSAEEDITRVLTRAVEPPTHRVLAASTTRTRAKPAARARATARPARKPTRSLAGRKTATIAAAAPSAAASAAATKDTGDTSLAPARTTVAAGVLGLVALVLAVTLWRVRRRRAGRAL